MQVLWERLHIIYIWSLMPNVTRRHSFKTIYCGYIPNRQTASKEATSEYQTA